MKTLHLTRYCYRTDLTLGWLRGAGDTVLHTIEAPWVPGEYLGGTPYRSCVPDGPYRLEYGDSPKHGPSWYLEAPELGVYRHERDLPGPGQGRWGCLIHVGNFGREVRGCIAPGTGIDYPMQWGERQPAVRNSRIATKRVHEWLDPEDDVRLLIAPVGGACGVVSASVTGS